MNANSLTAATEIAQSLVLENLVVFLDYDGTICPIVDDPNHARISGTMRAVIEELADRCSTVIVSGRPTRWIRASLCLSSLYYVGNHGLHIEGPEESGITRVMGEDFRGLADAFYDKLTPLVQKIEGALVEHGNYSVTVHYRNVAPDQVVALEKIVDGTLEQFPTLCKVHGKKIFEARPNIEWDKGIAALWLLGHLGHELPGVQSIYIGDDVSDEAAFWRLKGRAISILVTESETDTVSDYFLRNSEEVEEFLDRLVGRFNESDASSG